MDVALVVDGFYRQNRLRDVKLNLFMRQNVFAHEQGLHHYMSSGTSMRGQLHMQDAQQGQVINAAQSAYHDVSSRQVFHDQIEVHLVLARADQSLRPTNCI